jgi:hypothetical protein
MFKKVVAIASVTALLAASPAFAHGYRHEDWGHHDHGGGNGALIALGAFAAFAGVAAVLSAQHQEAPPPVAYVPPPAYPAPGYYAPAPAYYAPAYAPGYYAPSVPAQN